MEKSIDGKCGQKVQSNREKKAGCNCVGCDRRTDSVRIGEPVSKGLAAEPTADSNSRLIESNIGTGLDNHARE
jgi:hypothetical protein